ncbi:MEDS domain-containing protein [Haloarcula litorea]|uniref:MEDS domain-containing protein n=1 Tax=Haloarcula litorea TaxID=3032579 RepID=UPI0023E890CF|nr:MEDS domain-containing protein [Halomicroarcula sp. GDY20]
MRRPEVSDSTHLPHAATPTVDDFRATLNETDLARHLAYFYESPRAQLALAAEFIDYGLQSNYKCLYLTDENSPAAVESAFSAAGIDVAQRREESDLCIDDASNVYLESGFDPDRMVSRLESACDDSVEAGYEGLFVAGENTWCFHTESSFDHIVRFESDFDEICPTLPVHALCQYDLTRFSEESIAKALWTHEQVVYRNMICENPYYISPSEYTTTERPELNARLMLEQMHDLTQAHRDIEQRDQRLTVLNRVLRHNISNDLTVIAGTLDALAEMGDFDEPMRERVHAAIQHCEKIAGMSDKARYIRQTIGQSRTEHTELGPVIDRAIDQLKIDHPDANVTISGRYDIDVFVDENFDIAVHEILIALVLLQETDPGTVSITLSTPRPDTATLDFHTPGVVIPEQTQKAIQQGYETQLEHGYDIGLWLVKWIVENAYGSLSFPPGQPEEPQFRLQIRRLTD